MEISYDYEVTKTSRGEWITWIADTILQSQQATHSHVLYNLGYHVAHLFTKHAYRRVACGGVIYSLYGHGHGILLHIFTHRMLLDVPHFMVILRILWA